MRRAYRYVSLKINRWVIYTSARDFFKVAFGVLGCYSRTSRNKMSEGVILSGKQYSAKTIILVKKKTNKTTTK